MPLWTHGGATHCPLAVASLLAARLAGCKVDLENGRLSITAVNVEDAPLEFSVSGHPVIDVTAFGDLSLVPPQFRDVASDYYIGGDNGCENPPQERGEQAEQQGPLHKMAHGTRKKLAKVMANLTETFKTDTVKEQRAKRWRKSRAADRDLQWTCLATRPR